MRVSTSMLYDRNIASLERLNSQSNETQQQLATGRRLQRAGDDPAAAGRLERIDAELAARERYVENASRAEELLEQEETVLGQVVDTLQRIRELTLQAGDGALTPIDRSYLGTELGVRFEELVGLLNSRDAEGTYLFSGLQNGEPPFAFDAQGLRYEGDGGQRQITIAEGRRIPISDSGEQVFERILAPTPSLRSTAVSDSAEALRPGIRVVDREALSAQVGSRFRLEFDSAPNGVAVTVTDVASGLVVDGIEGQPFDRTLSVPSLGAEITLETTPSAGDALLLEASPRRDLLSMVADITDALASDDTPINLNASALQTTIADTLNGVDAAMNQIIDTQAGIGARLNALDDARSLHEDLILRSQETVSSLRDVDFAEAVSNLNYQAFLLEAAQQSYVRLTRISLF
ncbi:MAG: flagellar hook-associated protein FlgL, partial [Pseudomonadota bacterium]